MSSINFTFTNPWYLLFMIPAVELIIIPFLFQSKQRRRSFKKIAPLVLHIIIAVVLVLFMAGFSIIKNTSEQAVVIVADLSHSMEGVRQSVEEHIDSLVDEIDSSTPLGIVVFGGDAVYSLEISSFLRTYTLDKVDVDATDIEGAIQYAVSLAPEDKALRLILMTDGKENAGKAEFAAYSLVSKGIRLDGVYFDTTGISTGEVQISSLSCQPSGYIGDEVSFSSLIKSNVEQKVSLVLKEGERELERREVELYKGDNTISFTHVENLSGIHSYTLEIETDNDTYDLNNQMQCYFYAAEATHVLVIADNYNEGLRIKELIGEEGYVVKTYMPYEAPRNIIDLCNYDQVILSNVSYYDLPTGFDGMLEKFVSVYGRSLLALGGDETFMFGDMSDTIYEKMMPVSFEFNEDLGNKVALMLVIDCSSSMGGSSNNQKLAIAKQGAVKCLEAMGDSDFVGVVSFNSLAYVEHPLVQSNSANKDILTRVIAGLKTGSGTYYTEAIKAAHGQLVESTAEIKHIIFLSDGQPSDSGYYAAIEEAVEDGITVSTIGLGFSSSMLETMAYYGKGRYYYVSSATSLPDIMLSETEQSRVSSYILGDIVPEMAAAGEFTAGFEDVILPTLGGYLGTTLKEGANEYIRTPTGHPIYAEWEYGFGKVGCFTSDWYGEWSDRWFGSETGVAIGERMVSSLTPLQHIQSTIGFEAEISGREAALTITTEAVKKNEWVKLIISHGGRVEELTPDKAYEGVYAGRMELWGEGVYRVTVEHYNRSDELLESMQTAFYNSYSKEYDMFEKGGKGMLVNLCNRLGGTIWDDMSALADVECSEVKLVYQPLVPLALLVLVLFIVDVAIRKLRWKDIKDQFGSWFKKST